MTISDRLSAASIRVKSIIILTVDSVDDPNVLEIVDDHFDDLCKQIGWDDNESEACELVEHMYDLTSQDIYLGIFEHPVMKYLKKGSTTKVFSWGHYYTFVFVGSSVEELVDKAIKRAESMKILKPSLDQ